ncbi:MAG: citrate (Si)-synthase [Simkaniaceae bacterium]|nr:citrate (Si)-synthase [Simkaniaceae bacterium]
MGKVLFEITEELLETGLRGVPVGYCTTSRVDPEKGLFYREKPINYFKAWDPEKVIHFLYSGKVDGFTQFNEQLKNRASLSPDTVAAIQRLPREGHPMKLFSAALLILGMIEGKNDYYEDGLNLIAKAPHLTATVINFHAGWGETAPPDPALGYMENFAEMVNVPSGDKVALTAIFRLFNILHYDHGGGNLSTFVGKAIASGKEDMFGSICGAMCALAGPLHGKANQDALIFVQDLLKAVSGQLSEEAVEKELREKLSRKEVIYGFGHAVLRQEDSRAAVLYDLINQQFGDNPLVKMANLLRSVGPKVLKENPKISDPYPNVDAVSGTALSAAGFGYPEYFTVLFGLSRMVGIVAQIMYERLEARGGKGTPIVRPKYIYKPS